MDRAAQTETPTAVQNKMQGVGGTPPPEAVSSPPVAGVAPAETTTPPFSITGLSNEAPTSNASASVLGMEAPQVQQLTQNNSEGFAQVSTPPEVPPAITTALPPPEQPVTNVSSQEYAQTPAQTPDTVNQAQAEADMSISHAGLTDNSGGEIGTSNQAANAPELSISQGVVSGIDSNSQAPSEFPVQNPATETNSVPDTGIKATENMAFQLGENIASIEDVNAEAQKGFDQIKGTALEGPYLAGYSQGVAISLAHKK